MGCGASVAEDDGGWGKSDSEVGAGVFTGSTPARASRRSPCLCHLDVFGGARARGRGFSLRDGCPVMSAACYWPRLLLRGLVTGRRQDAQGAAQAGAKHSGWFPTSDAVLGSSLPLVWERWRVRRLSVLLASVLRPLARLMMQKVTSNAALRLPQITTGRVCID